MQGLPDRDESFTAKIVLQPNASGFLDVVFHQLDITNPTSITRAVDFVKTHFKKLDILVIDLVKLSIAEKEFNLTLIARRSRHYVGTRYLKRGVNEKGRVANDIETEKIVFEDVPEGCPVQISSIVQNRGSIPLFWSQETSRLNIKPDIILNRRLQD
ncbi:hypothetical protein L2E82_14367 [Cichorium intybus]|uniref:Uncharacterized protein n=1 Tax=Cichorium intybus TaxID=13427 RepID=A0ACB9F0F3_CICIN|nr:hypothetical protein L2E82_14367 [Cichorium intybus]